MAWAMGIVLYVLLTWPKQGARMLGLPTGLADRLLVLLGMLMGAGLLLGVLPRCWGYLLGVLMGCWAYHGMLTIVTWHDPRDCQGMYLTMSWHCHVGLSRHVKA